MTRQPGRGMKRRTFVSAGSAAIAIAILPSPLRAAGTTKQVNVYSFDTYIGDNTIANFTAATKIAVRYDVYANNEELFAKLKTKNPGYDVIVPSDYMVETMIGAKMLIPIDKAKIPNLANIDPAFTNPRFDPGMKYSVPYMWGTVGIGYRKSKVKGEPARWSYIFGPEADAYKGRIVALDDQRVMIGVALKYLGYSLNSTKKEEIAAARDLLIKAKKNFKTFSPDGGQDILLAGDADLVVEYNGDIIQVMRQDKDLSYVLPKEGSMRWTDCLCVPKGAPNPDNASAWINFVQNAKQNAEIVGTIHYATPNAAARKLVDPADLKNPIIYPPDAILAKCEMVIDLGKNTRLYDEAWTAVKAA